MTSSSSSSPEIHSTPLVDPTEHFSYRHATHEEVLEDLFSRFLFNLPEEELSSPERICFQVEQAHWFYEDFIREQNPEFPSLPLKKFSAMVFQTCPLLHKWSHDHEQAFNAFIQYKNTVPVCGAIMLNDTWEKCILTKGSKSSSGWGFPKGKINEGESTHECAIREVLEETAYNLEDQLNPENVIQMSIKKQLISLFVVPGVPEDFPFKTRKEISRIEWFRLTDLPTWKRNKAAPGKFYLISPFIASLEAFVIANKPQALEGRARQKRGYTSTENGTQESSPSSADNGEPQTPSPQYSEALPVTSHRIAMHESDDEQVVYPETIDPHFARLLSSLTLSAIRQDNSRPQSALPTVKLPLSVLADTGPPLAKQNIVNRSSRVSAHAETPAVISSPHPKQRLSKTSTPSMRRVFQSLSTSTQASSVESSILRTSPFQVPTTSSSGALSTVSLSAPSSTSSVTSSRKSLSSRRSRDPPQSHLSTPPAGVPSFVLQRDTAAGAPSKDKDLVPEYFDLPSPNPSQSHLSIPPEEMLQDLTEYITKDEEFPTSRGGFGEVWKCTYKTDQRQSKVAVKALMMYSSDQFGEAKEKKIKESESTMVYIYSLRQWSFVEDMA